MSTAHKIVEGCSRAYLGVGPFGLRGEQEIASRLGHVYSGSCRPMSVCQSRASLEKGDKDILDGEVSGALYGSDEPEVIQARAMPFVKQALHVGEHQHQQVRSVYILQEGTYLDQDVPGDTRVAAVDPSASGVGYSSNRPIAARRWHRGRCD